MLANQGFALDPPAVYQRGANVTILNFPAASNLPIHRVSFPLKRRAAEFDEDRLVTQPADATLVQRTLAGNRAGLRRVDTAISAPSRRRFISAPGKLPGCAGDYPGCVPPRVRQSGIAEEAGSIRRLAYENRFKPLAQFQARANFAQPASTGRSPDLLGQDVGEWPFRRQFGHRSCRSRSSTGKRRDGPTPSQGTATIARQAAVGHHPVRHRANATEAGRADVGLQRRSRQMACVSRAEKAQGNSERLSLTQNRCPPKQSIFF